MNSLTLQVTQTSTNQLDLMQIDREEKSPSTSMEVDMPLIHSLPLELFHRVLLALPFRKSLTARLVCKFWEKQIDTIKEVGKGKLVHQAILDDINILADKCAFLGLIDQETKKVSNNVFLGIRECITRAQCNFSSALTIFRHLNARLKFYENPKERSSIRFDLDIPYVNLSRNLFTSLFVEKVNQFNSQERQGCYTFYPIRSGCNQIGAIFVENHNISYGYFTEEDLKSHNNDLKKIVEIKANYDTPIFFSKEEVSKIKNEIRDKRLEKGSEHPEIVTLPFYHSNLKKKDAIEKLTGQPPKTFLIRPSSSNKFDAVISYVTFPGQIVHLGFTVIQSETSIVQFFFEEDGILFEDLSGEKGLFNYLQSRCIFGLLPNAEIPETFRQDWILVYSLPCYLTEFDNALKSQISNMRKYSDKDYIFLFFDDKENTLMMGRQYEFGLILESQEKNFSFRSLYEALEKKKDCDYQLLDRNLLHMQQRINSEPNPPKRGYSSIGD